jgi:hypothetical protein
MFTKMYTGYCILMVVVMFVLSAPASATGVAHALVGGVVITKVTGASTSNTSVDYNVNLPTLELCEAAITKIEQASFSPSDAVTQPVVSLHNVQKLVFLQCVQRAGVAE